MTTSGRARGRPDAARPRRRGRVGRAARMRERLTVVGFALLVLAVIVAGAFALGYLVGKLLI